MVGCMDYKEEKNFWGFLYMYQVIIFRLKEIEQKHRKNFAHSDAEKLYWAGQKFHLGFPLRCYRKT